MNLARAFCKNCGHSMDMHTFITRSVYGKCQSGHSKGKTCRCEVFMDPRRYYKRDRR